MKRCSLLVFVFFFSCLMIYSQTKISFDYIGNFSDGLAPVQKGNLWGFINTKGELVVDLKYMAGFDVPFYSMGMCVIYSHQHDARGYLNNKGEVAIPFVYYSAMPFYDSVTLVYTPGAADGSHSTRVSIIDMKGKIIVEQAPTAYSYETYFVEGLARILKDFGCGFMNTKGKIVVETKYDDARDFSEGKAAVRFTNSLGESKWGYIDKTGKVVIDFIFKNEPSAFKDGRAFIKGNNGNYGIIDTSGKVIVEPKYNNIFPFEGGITTANYIDEKWQSHYEIIDANGKVLKTFPKEKDGSQVQLMSGFKDGIALAMKNYKYGFIDKKGNTVVGFQFRKLNQMNNGLAYAEKFDDKTKKVTYGYINIKGNFVIVNEPPKF